jgi:hypothetical protein
VFAVALLVSLTVIKPRPWRRYFGSPVTALPVVSVAAAEEEQFLSQVLRFAVSVSAKTNKNTRPQGTKRVNPSSGALHPEEVYILASQGEACMRLLHYAPNDHAVEELRRLPMSRVCPRNLFLFGLACIRERETWKYGARGCRYAALDMGHVLGALIVSLGRHRELVDLR